MELEIGKIYRAISDDEVVELKSVKRPGIKLLVIPQRIKHLKKLQKTLEKRTGYRPDLEYTINLLLVAVEAHFTKHGDSEIFADMHQRMLMILKQRKQK